MRLQGKRVAILAEDLYEEMELWAPYFRLKEEGAEVVLVGSGRARQFAGKHGYPVTVDTDADQVEAGEFDGVVVPGGFAPDKLRRYPPVLNLVREAFAQGKVVASTCHGPWVLASARILRGRTATCVSAIRDDIENAGAEYVDSPVVVDGNLITSRHVNDIPDFCRALVAQLG